MLHPPGNHDEPKRPPEQLLSAAEPMNRPNMQRSVPLTSCAHPATRNRGVCRHFAGSLPAESHARSYYRGSAPGTSQPPFWVPANRPGASLGPAQSRHYFRPDWKPLPFCGRLASACVPGGCCFLVLLVEASLLVVAERGRGSPGYLSSHPFFFNLQQIHVPFFKKKNLKRVYFFN